MWNKNNSIISEFIHKMPKRNVTKMFDPENVVYNTETKRYEIVDVELPDDYFIKDENGEWVELKPLSFEQKVEMELKKPEIQQEIADAFPFVMPTDEDLKQMELEQMAKEFKFEFEDGEMLLGMEY